MHKVIYITNKIPNYRQGLYEKLGKELDLTIAHYGDVVQSINFKQLSLNITHLGPFIKINNIINFSDYDVVMVWANIRLLILLKLLFKSNRGFKLIVFGPGVSASYNKKYDSVRMKALSYRVMLNRVDAAIFYDNYPVIKYSGLGINPFKLFCAPNTIDIEPKETFTNGIRDTFLFFGTLYKEKGTFILLEAYKILNSKLRNMPILNIVGDGPESLKLQKWVSDNSLSEKIQFHGRITDRDKIRGVFNNAIVCISPKQAGLSVIESLAHGVPFVTSKYPITGGEYNAIIEGANGFFFDETKEGLAKTLEEVLNIKDFDFYSKNCTEYYKRFRSPRLWISQVIRAINFSLNSK